MINDLMVDVLANLVKRHRRISLTAAADILGMDFEELSSLAKVLSDREEFELFDNSICFLMPRDQDAYRVRLRSHYIEKYAIGRLATSFFKTGDHVVVESGSTMTILAQHLAQVQQIKVSTNSYAVASMMIGAETAADIHVIGGNLYTDGQGLWGQSLWVPLRALRRTGGLFVLSVCPLRGISCTTWKRKPSLRGPSWRLASGLWCCVTPARLEFRAGSLPTHALRQIC